METNKPVEQSGDNPYRSPIFRRVSGPHIVGKNLEHTGLVMEWWQGPHLCHVDVLHHCPLKEKGTNYSHEAVFPAERIATAVEAASFSVVEVNGKKYLPLDALLTALFQSGKANRPFMEVIREFPHPIQDLSKWHSAPQRGNLIDQLEDEGFELYLCDAAVKAQGKFIQQIFWLANAKCPVHAAEIAADWGNWFRESETLAVAPVDEAGILRIPWPRRAGRSMINLLLATATAPWVPRPSPEAVADAWVGQADGRENYFFKKRAAWNPDTG